MFPTPLDSLSCPCHRGLRDILPVLHQRQLALREAQQQLAQLSRQVQATVGPQREQQAQACVRTLDALAREQRTK